MFTYKFVRSLRAVLVSTTFTRNKGTGKGTITDPVQQLFLDKIREYRTKSPKDQMVDPSPLILNEMKHELEKLEKNFGGGPGVDMTAFPKFKFQEPKLDPIDETIPEKEGKKKKRGVKRKRKAGKKGHPKKK